MDFACGKGQDLHRYNRRGVKEVTFIDNSLDALEELNERKYTIQANMKINIIHADLTSDEASDRLTQLEKVDIVVINFAIHYLISDDLSLSKLALLVKKCVKLNGLLLITCFNYASVMDLIEKEGVFEGNTHKISLKSKGKLPIIDVYHHFNNEPISERLIPSNWLCDSLKMHRINLIRAGKFDDQDVTGEDKLYHNLYHYYVFKVS